MKTSPWIATLGLLATPVLAATVGQPAPDFSLTDIHGKTVRLADFQGKTVVLEWNNPECPFVKKHYDAKNMQGQQKEATGNDVVWLSINSGAAGKQGHMDAAKARQVTEKLGFASTAYLLDGDGKVGRSYAAKVTPHMYIIDGDGVLRYNGAIDSNPSADPADIPGATQYVRQGLAELAAGKPISVTTTTPYGCSVKY